MTPFILNLSTRLRCEADHSPPSSAEAKNTWSYTSTPPIRFQGVVLSQKYRDSFTLLDGGESLASRPSTG
jgi:hypothetical protein